ncbi:MBL fold metallo-hydrolase [Salinarimonas chemoclinalis]|uniref:MBL fold metallo-hydrolase n=1 Tax=Salinarimonas chemoclinalis TaxID=3241599 RepID=UPI0035563239
MRLPHSPSRGPGSPDVQPFYDAATGSLQYVVSCPDTRRAAIVDPVLELDPRAAATRTDLARDILAHLAERGLAVDWILDTHPHADHLSAAAWLKERTGAPIAIGERVRRVQEIWRDLYAMDDFPADGSQWDRLFADGDTFRIGGHEARVMLSTGHTVASVTYVVGDAAFVHDTLMMPDSGSSRADFPGGDAGELYDSIMAILALPDDTRLFVGHDYQPGGRPPAGEATVAEHKASNKHFEGNPSREAFVRIRSERDATLPLPDRMLMALQVNMNGMRLPEPDAKGRRILRIPLDRFPFHD